MTNRRFLSLAFVSTALLGLWLYVPTFGNSYAYDDIDYLNHAADVLAGRAPFWAVLFRPQGEHFVPILRLILMASGSLFGTNAMRLRLLVFASHLLSALFVALTARRLLRDDAAGFASGILYVLPCGFSSMWLWFPSGGCVPIGIAGVTGALAAATSDAARAEILNVGVDVPTTFRELAETLSLLTGARWEYAPFSAERKAQEPGDFYSDISKIRRLLGWSPRTPLREGLEKTIAFYRLHKANYW